MATLAKCMANPVQHSLARIVAAFALLALAEAALAERPADAPPSLTHYRCYICHSDRETLVGPAFADVARFYRGRADAIEKIASKIRTGRKGGGPWHMPPHPEVSPEEAREMARYIMLLEPSGTAPREVKQP